MALDITAYLWSEVEDWAKRLLIEIHTLASAYGWREAELLALEPAQREAEPDLDGEQQIQRPMNQARQWCGDGVAGGGEVATGGEAPDEAADENLITKFRVGEVSAVRVTSEP